MNRIPSASPEVITCEDVSVGYGSSVILRHVNLAIRPGMFIPFVGPNGAGKTTLLRTLLGLIRPRAGRVRTPFHARPPGYVPQQTAIDPLYPVSVAQIVAMGFYPQVGWWRRMDPSQKQVLNRALAQFDLASHAHKTYGELSGGMKQKALIARALVSGAQVFVMDEPASELDALSEAEVLSHLKRLTTEEGKTVLMAHHGLHDLADLSDIVCMVRQGSAKMVRAASVVPRKGEGQPISVEMK